jgi:hypothetical protein
MNPNKALWEKGDFTRIAASMREGGEALVGALGIKSGFKVSRTNDTLSCGTPALANRSITLASSPHVIGLIQVQLPWRALPARG